jgi:hypothetical protein
MRIKNKRTVERSSTRQKSGGNKKAKKKQNKTPSNVEQTPSSAIPAVQNIRVCIFNNAFADVSADDGE